jgi:class 3 adenylate cyclase
MSFLRALWNWNTFVLAGLSSSVVLFAGPLGGLLGTGREAGAAWLTALAVAWAGLTTVGALASTRAAKGKQLRPLEKFSTLVSTLLLVGVLGILGRAVLAFAPQGSQTALAVFLDRTFDPTWQALAGVGVRIGVPPDLAGIPTAPLALLTLLFFGRNAVSWRIDKLRQGVYREDVSLPTDIPIQPTFREEARERAEAVERRIAAASRTEAKTLPHAPRTELTCVLLEVVDSTALEDGEHPYVVEQPFGDYRDVVERSFRRHGACKQVFTPNRQVAAFQSPQAGVDCAKEIFLELRDFKQHRSRLGCPVRIRAGADVGPAYTDDHTPIERIPDASMDALRRLNTHANADTLCITEELYRRLENPAGFSSTGKEVDGRGILAWKIA